MLLVEEAGGVVTALNGSPIDIMTPSLLSASSRAISENLTTVLS